MLQADLPGGPIGRDIDYGTADFQRITEILHEVSGIRMPPTNEALVFSRLSRRVRELGMSRFCDYVDHVQAARNADEREAMVEALTTNTTRFFREGYHFDTLAEALLPDLVQKARAGARAALVGRLLDGEEAYSIAAVVLKHFAEAGRHDLRILATDISRRVLAVAERAEYPADRAEAITPELAALMFERGGEKLRIRPALRELVSFRYMNFMEPWPVTGPFDAIFCRNVMIYMEDDVQARVWAGLASVLAPGGTLFTGHSERIGPELKGSLQMVGKTTFRRV
ncbi:CheR family methyltransferase [Seohaeicola zhoushanensis]